MGKVRTEKYRDAQLLLSRAVNKSSQLLFTGDNDRYEQAEHDLVDAAVSKLHEAQSLLMKARLRLKDDG